MSTCLEPRTTTQPVLFLSHGGGPSFFMPREKGSLFEDIDSESESAEWFRNSAALLDLQPSAILVVSAHYESDRDKEVIIVENDPQSLLFDYYGFPPSTYDLQYPVPLAKHIIPTVRELLASAGFVAKAAPKDRGLDHGVFLPLKLMFPEAQIPVLQVSLCGGLDPQTHINLGRAMAPLRNQGVLIIGSGFTTHNLRAMGQGPPRGATTWWGWEFEKWIDSTTTSESDPKVREESLVNWANAPGARMAHPRSEHLMPLLVAAGAANLEPAQKVWEKWVVKGSSLLSHYKWI